MTRRAAKAFERGYWQVHYRAASDRYQSERKLDNRRRTEATATRIADELRRSGNYTEVWLSQVVAFAPVPTRRIRKGGDEVKRIEVKGCGDCPFSSYGDDPPGAYCGASKPVVWIAPDFEGPPPDWCPLRKSDHLVTLRAK